MLVATVLGVIVGIGLATAAVAQLDPVCSACESKICSYQKSLTCSCTNASRIVEIVNPGDREYTQVSLGFAIDDTGSMTGVIDSVKSTVQGVVTATSAIFDKYIIGTFNDPYIYNLMESTDVTAINNFVSRIYAHDGGDCPEMALTGIRDVANRATPGSAIFVFTDASAKDLDLEADVRALLLAKDIRLNVIAVGNLCGLGGYEFTRLTNATKGSMYTSLVQLDVQYVMNYIAKYAKYGIRFVRGLPSTLDDLRTLTTGNCSCTVGLIRNLTCLPLETTRATTRPLETNTSSTIGDNSTTKCGTGFQSTSSAFRLALLAIGLVTALQIYVAQ